MLPAAECRSGVDRRAVSTAAPGLLAPSSQKATCARTAPRHRACSRSRDCVHDSLRCGSGKARRLHIARLAGRYVCGASPSDRETEAIGQDSPKAQDSERGRNGRGEAELKKFLESQDAEVIQGSTEVFVWTCSLSLAVDVWGIQTGHDLDGHYLIAALFGSLACGIAASQLSPPTSPLVGKESTFWPRWRDRTRGGQYHENGTFNSSNGGRNSKAMDMSKVKVRRTVKRLGRLPRHKYTITHNDFTGVIQLRISDEFHFGIDRSDNIYSTALRDEVLGEWHVTESQSLQLHLHCRVGLSWTPIPLMYLRNYVFRKDMPMVVDALLQAERQSILEYPGNISVYVHFHSASPRMNSWDTLFASENQTVLLSIDPQDDTAMPNSVPDDEEEEETYASMRRRKYASKPRIATRAEIAEMLPDVAKLSGTKLMLMAKSLELFFIPNRVELENSFETRTECWGSFEDGEWVSHVRSIVEEDSDDPVARIDESKAPRSKNELVGKFPASPRGPRKEAKELTSLRGPR